MKYVYLEKDSHLNPEAMLVLSQILRKGGRGANTASILLNLLYLASDENGEVLATRSALAEFAGCATTIVSAATKLLSDSGLVEYQLSRAKCGSLFRLNPHAVSVGRKYKHSYVELVNSETGEISKKREVEFAEEFKRLCRRYNGNQLNKKMIAEERKLFKLITSQTTQLHTL